METMLHNDGRTRVDGRVVAVATWRTQRELKLQQNRPIVWWNRAAREGGGSPTFTPLRLGGIKGKCGFIVRGPLAASFFSRDEMLSGTVFLPRLFVLTSYFLSAVPGLPAAVGMRCERRHLSLSSVVTRCEMRGMACKFYCFDVFFSCLSVAVLALA